MSQKQVFLSVLFFISFITLSEAQETNFRGSVLDESTEQPLEGVEVFYKNKMVVTDKRGRFAFYSDSSQLQVKFHFLGFKDNLITLKANRSKRVFMEESFQELEEVEIHEHGHEELSLSSMNVTSLNQYTLDAEKGTTISETLSKTPGVSFISTGVGISKPTVRGMAGSRVIVSVDGIKLEDQQWGMDHGLSVGQPNVDEVEIAKGAATIKYGSDGLGGVIKMKSPQPLGHDGVEGKFGLNYKNNNQYFSGDAKINGQKGKVFYQLSGGYEDFGNYRVPADQFTYLGNIYQLKDGLLVNTGGDISSFKAAIGYEGSHWVHSLSVSNFTENVGLFPGATGIPTNNWLASFEDNRKPEVPKQEIQHNMITYNSHVDVWGGNIWFDIAHQNNERKELSDPRRHGRPLNEQGFLANYLMLKTTSANVHFDKEGKVMHWEVGANYEFQRNIRDGFDFLIPNYDQSTFGGYAMFGLPLNERVKILGGLRFDYITFNSKEYKDPYFEEPPNSGNPWQRVDDINNQYENLSASFGVQFDLFNLIGATTNIARTFRAPRANELASNGVHHGTFRHEQGNPDLNPEQGYQWDLNLSYAKKKFDVQFNPYFNYYTNYIYLSAFPEPSPLPDAGQIYKYTEAQGYFVGYEFALNWEMTRNMKLHNSVEYVYSQNTERNRSFSFVPPLSSNTELTYTHTVLSNFFSKPFASANLQLTGDQNRVDINEPTTPGYAVVGLKFGTAFNMKRVYGNLIFRVDNLFDTYYMRHLSRYRILNLPEPGRNFSINLTAWF
ncbi:TonB-dependent receptor [Flammeovirga yaeyamensis]|uniref:TonB-dependent receptor n=1 Tax=Flammeovirga yaeyamensis TaxID=367791 RepID=A0AAX1N8F8_9BACT|nr:TonB-dependent receptor [Flammeovirga yaeyamensis]MBB3698759.1 iron complex outermembrane receptor protein [Flammeovirga yaeyamensis]NMF37344.1 TonB-dependent receptor [Flammeovirga yaeyamensis]QWG03839.1 TonB-dependent receptor [Flammeovirga yaeyamensis]